MSTPSFKPTLGLHDAAMVVADSMIGAGIFMGELILHGTPAEQAGSCS
jgi:hypothetical protein